MKILRVFFLSGLLILSSLFFSQTASASSYEGDIRVSYLEGDVQIKAAGTSEWVPASINMPLIEGDAVWVPDGGRFGLELRDGSFVRLNENTSLEVLAVGSGSYQFYLASGQAYMNFFAGRGAFLQMDTPVSSTRVYKRSKFRMDVSQSGDTDVSVFQGDVHVEGSSGKTTVVSGQMLSIGDSYAEIASLAPPDDWERWNRDMDSRRESSYSSRYLPSELSPYSYDFDENGKWVYTSDYGYCWTPTVISVGWAPYRFGRWTWIGGDYVWVSYDRWGWAPYHYGRWAFIGSVGWCWVPPAARAVYWGPGFVGWVSTGDYVSWVPLAPGDLYYGHGYYGPHSVNITNININTVHVTNVYKNVYVNNSITVVNRNTFITGRHETVDPRVVSRIRENDFIARKVQIGRPAIAPTKASYMPVVKSIPSSKMPPPHVRQIQVRQLRESRPMVKNRALSVFKPGTAPRKLPVTAVKEPRKPGAALQPRVVKPQAPGKETQQPQVIQRGIPRPGAFKEEKRPETFRREVPRPGATFKEEKKPQVIQREVPRPGGVIKEEKRPETFRREVPRPNNVIKEEQRPFVQQRQIQKPAPVVREKGKVEQKKGKPAQKEQDKEQGTNVR